MRAREQGEPFHNTEFCVGHWLQAASASFYLSAMPQKSVCAEAPSQRNKSIWKCSLGALLQHVIFTQ